MSSFEMACLIFVRGETLPPYLAKRLIAQGHDVEKLEEECKTLSREQIERLYGDWDE